MRGEKINEYLKYIYIINIAPSHRRSYIYGFSVNESLKAGVVFDIYAHALYVDIAQR